jgi:hypothetical protein
MMFNGMMCCTDTFTKIIPEGTTPPSVLANPFLEHAGVCPVLCQDFRTKENRWWCCGKCASDSGFTKRSGSVVQYGAAYVQGLIRLQPQIPLALSVIHCPVRLQTKVAGFTHMAACSSVEGLPYLTGPLIKWNSSASP